MLHWHRSLPRTVATLAAAGCLLLVATASGAPPDVPPLMSYQGVLLDDLGDPRTGNVDLTMRIYDTLAGGTLVYKQVFLATPLTDGTFTLLLGPTGAATDSPSNPLTTDFATVFSGDLAANPNRFAELTVGSDPPTARLQILAAPFALRAESAESADTAASADVAVDVTNLNGITSLAFSEMYEHFNFDGGGPANDDPSEGTGDTDNDGIANFVDPDNDDDGISDISETSNGSDINLVTPTVDNAIPNIGDYFFANAVTVSGTNFEPGITVQFGSESPAPSNISATSFDVTVGPQPVGFVDVTVTRLNGETVTKTNAFEFSLLTPQLSIINPSDGSINQFLTITISGQNFEPGMTVQFGSQNPVPYDVTPTSFKVDVNSATIGTVDVTVTRLNGESDTEVDFFEFLPFAGIEHGLGSPRVSTFDIKNIRHSLLGSLSDNYNYDSTGDGVPNAVVSVTGSGDADYAYDGSGNLQGVYCSQGGGNCNVWLLRDTDGDSVVNQLLAIESFGGGAPLSLLSSSVAFDPLERIVAGYVRGSASGADVVIAHDLDGDDDWTDSNELIALETGLSDADVDVAADSTGAPAVVYHRDPGGPGDLRLAHDRSGDGDYDDTVTGNPELSTIFAGDVDCFGVTLDGADRLAVVYQDSAGGGLTLLHDLNDDGDFVDGGESVTLTAGPATACGITTIDGGGVGLAENSTGDAVLYLDHTNDGDFDDANETLSTGPATVLGVATDDAGGMHVVTESEIFTQQP